MVTTGQIKDMIAWKVAMVQARLAIFSRGLEQKKSLTSGINGGSSVI